MIKISRPGTRKSIRFFGVLTVFLLLLLSGCNSNNDLSEMGWSDAFDRLHSDVSVRYPFTELKAIDWQHLYEMTAPRIAKAESEGDREAYYLALRAYAFSLRDGHVSFTGDDSGFRARALGGGYGLKLYRLDDGQVIAWISDENGPAAKAGIGNAAEITSWNNLPIDTALDNVSPILSPQPNATRAAQELVQLGVLARDTPGAECTIGFRNPGSNDVDSAILQAIADPPAEDGAIAEALRQMKMISEIRSDNIGYIRIGSFLPILAGLSPVRKFDRAIRKFQRRDVESIIIDVRNNGGGFDAMVPKMVGHFYSESAFYEDVSYYNADEKRFIIDPKRNLHIEPRSPHFDKPVAVLVDLTSMSTAEGIPLAIKPLEMGHVIGLEGTNGSFAVDCGDFGADRYKLPGDLNFSFMSGRSLDQSGNIQIDADAFGTGGIEPDVRVPMNLETVQALNTDGRDVVLEYAIAYLKGGI